MIGLFVSKSELEENLRESDLEKLTYRHRFSKYLPYTAYDPEKKLYINQDGTVGFMWECTPLYFASERVAGDLAGIFAPVIPSGSVIQFILIADDYVDHILDDYLSRKVRKDELVRRQANEFVRFIKKGKDGFRHIHGIPLRNFRLIVAFKAPEKKVSDENLRDIRATIFEALKGAGLNPSYFEPGDFLFLMRRLLNGTDVLAGVSSVDVLRRWDERIPLRKQIIFAGTEIEFQFRSCRIGDRYLRFLTPKQFPKEVDFFQHSELTGGIWGVKSDTNQILTPFILSWGIIFEDLRMHIHRRANLILQQEGFGSFVPALRREQEEHVWAADEVEKGTRFVRLIPILITVGKSEDEAVESQKRLRRLFESKGYVMQEDGGIIKILLISALPFGIYNVGKNIEFLDRDFIAPVDSVIQTLPIQADFQGSGGPSLVFIGRKGQLATLDIFDPSAPSSNMCVMGTTGGGKSFFMNYVVYNYFSNGAVIRLVDIGKSYEKLCSMVGGQFIDFSEKICLNPFSLILDPEYDLQVIADIIAQMVYSSSKQKPTETEMTLIKHAVRWAYKNFGEDASIDDVYVYLKEFPEKCEEDEELFTDTIRENLELAAHTLAFNLQSFTSSGEYGPWFNGPSTLKLDNELVVLELESLYQRKELFAVVTLQLLNRMTQELYLSDRSKPRLIIFEEGGVFFKGSELFRDVTEEGYRRARKYGGSFTTVFQSVLDLASSSMGDLGKVILGNSHYKIFLESPDYERAASSKLIPDNKFIVMIMSSLRRNYPGYSEIFLDTPFGRGVVRLVVDHFSYYIYTTRSSEVSEMERLRRKYGSYVAAIEELAKRRAEEVGF